MAAPNLINIANVTAKSLCVLLTTANVAVLTNAVASGKVLKINSIRITNIDGTNVAYFTGYLFDAAAAGSSHFGVLIDIAPKTSMMLVTKEDGLYLEEGDSLNFLAQANGDLSMIVSYEELS